MHKLLILSTLLYIATHNFSMQQYVVGATNMSCDYRVVEGDIFLMRYPILYRGKSTKYNNFERLNNIVDSDGKRLTIDPQDILVHVWANNVKCSDKESWRHPILGWLTFTTFLPLFLLQDKKEGDIISFFVKNQESSEIVLVKLRCAQLKSRYCDWGSFEKTLETLVTRFINEPVCYDTIEEQKSGNYLPKVAILHNLHSSYWEQQRKKAYQYHQDVKEALEDHFLETSSSCNYRIVEGTIFLVHNSLLYRGKSTRDHTFEYLSNIVDSSGKQLTIEPHDILVDVWIKSVKLSNFLPLFLLQDKKEGDIISFFFKHQKSSEIVLVKLHCTQLKSPYYNSKPFEKALDSMIKIFIETPVCYDQIEEQKSGNYLPEATHLHNLRSPYWNQQREKANQQRQDVEDTLEDYYIIEGDHENHLQVTRIP